MTNTEKLRALIRSADRYARNLYDAELSVAGDGVEVTLVEGAEIQSFEFVQFATVGEDELVCFKNDDGRVWMSAHGEVVARFLLAL